VPDEFLEFCEGKDQVLVIEEGQPEFIEQQLTTYLYRAGSKLRLHGKDIFADGRGIYRAGHAGRIDGLPAAGRPRHAARQVRAPNEDRPQIPDLSKTVPIRPPGFCTGCPERPIFAAMKLVQQELGQHQIAADIGCHLFGSLPPFEVGGRPWVMALALRQRRL
jgi:indolepyruvate ferredoxin oxidoreductase, alpha subunit